MSSPQATFRKDYQPSSYLIHTTELWFYLTQEQTIVDSVIHFYKNPLSAKANQLFLNGVDLELLSITINGVVPDYLLVDGGLELNQLTDEFVLKISTRIHPENNTSLNGLYQSNGNFCTQCEAHGFRQISYYLDRPDVLSVFTTHIQANIENCSVLLSNGNLIAANSDSATWHDPAPKPCYLFALVAGDFKVLEDNYTTKSGVEVALKIYVEAHNIHKTQFAMNALKRAFAWDEARFNLEYDLDIYMLVAVDDFNMGAMENKGLNIFNSAYVLANSNTATDKDFIDIEAVIGHEYFHNWTGNRVTCKDWFQLSLKEGLTVFRDQEFTSDLHARPIKRIQDVKTLRSLQFAEDLGPLRHPVRPEHYIEMNNFYTMTVYEKGAEIVRMLHTILGEANFQQGMRLYFQRFDGRAVEIEDFVACMNDTKAFDFDSFMLWYSTSGTPKIHIKNQANIVTITQNDKRLTPIKYGVLNESGKQIKQGMLVLDKPMQQFDFSHLPKGCTFSWLRDFSAPVKLTSNITTEQQLFLCEYDNDSFNRWDNMQSLWLSFILNPNKIDSSKLFITLENILSKIVDNSLLSELLKLPSQRFLHQQVSEIDVFDIEAKRNAATQKIIQHFQPKLLKIYQQLNVIKDYKLTPDAVGKRALKNICLEYLVKAGNVDLAYKQFESASCMTDYLAAFNSLLLVENPYQNKAITKMFSKHQNDVQVMDKWFAAQALSPSSDVNNVKKLMQHPLFSFDTPNRLRSVIGSFSQNFAQFHKPQGYKLFTEIVLKLNLSNPQIGARLVANYNHWKCFTPTLKNLQKQQLEKIIASKNLSNDIFEIVQTALK